MENLMRFDVTNERNLTMLVDFYELTTVILIKVLKIE